MRRPILRCWWRSRERCAWLRGACLLVGGQKEIIAALDHQLALTVAGCTAGMLPEDRARVESAAAL
jgi:hypothetical protein